MSLVLTGILVLYVLTTVALLVGTLRSNSRHGTGDEQDLPSTSVLVAARNEAESIADCVGSLLESDYPRERLEIIVIDDRSTDATAAVVAAIAKRESRLKLVSVHNRLPDMSGKASTICQGIKHARGEILLITDADCIVPPTWVRAMVTNFSPETGLVGGLTQLSPFRAISGKLPSTYRDHLPAKVQTVDWMYLLTVGSGAAGLGMPVSILGNNFAFRRQAYEQVGGYEQIGFSIIEDFALMQKIVTETKFTVRFPLDYRTSVFSFPPASIRQFLDQRKRWAAGGKEVGWFAKYLMVLAFSRHLAILLSAFISWQFTLAGLAAVMATDFSLLLRSAIALKRTDLMRHFFAFECYYLLYSFLFAPTVLFPATVHWKGVRYRWGIDGKIKRIEENTPTL